MKVVGPGWGQLPAWPPVRLYPKQWSPTFLASRFHGRQFFHGGVGGCGGDSGDNGKDGEW